MSIAKRLTIVALLLSIFGMAAPSFAQQDPETAARQAEIDADTETAHARENQRELRGRMATQDINTEERNETIDEINEERRRAERAEEQE